MVLSVSKRPMRLAKVSVNQLLPSRATVMPETWAPGLATGYSVTTPAVVMRATPVAASVWANHGARSPPSTMSTGPRPRPAKAELGDGAGAAPTGATPPSIASSPIAAIARTRPLRMPSPRGPPDEAA